MKEKLEEILSKPIDKITIEELLNCFEILKDAGDNGIIKFDGLRKENHYTVVITINSLRDTNIRNDDSSLKGALVKALIRYNNTKNW
jgi:hypothetical protein